MYRTLNFTFYIFIGFVFLICDAFPHNSINPEVDSARKFFNHIELLKRSNYNVKAIHLLLAFIDEKTNETDTLNLLRAYNEQAENYRWSGKYDQAVKKLTYVENFYQINPTLDKIELIRFNFYKGKIYRSTNVPDSAELYYEKAFDLIDKNNLQETSIKGEIWMELGLFYVTEKEDREKAILYYMRAHEVFQDALNEFNIKFAVLYYSLATNFRAIGDFERAINYSRMSEIVYKINGSLFENRKINCKVVQGNCFFQDNNFQQANLIYEEIIELFQTSISPTRDALRIALLNNGIALFNIGKYNEAKQYIEKSIKLNLLEYEIDSVDLIISNINLSLVLEELGAFDQANNLLRKNILMCNELFGEKHFEVFDSYRYLGKHYEKQGKLDQALIYYQKSLIAGFYGFNGENIYSNPSSFDSLSAKAAFNILFDKARTFRKRHIKEKRNGDLLAAFDLYKTAYALIRKIANSNMMEESLLNIPEDFHEDLNYGVECALTLFENTNNHEYLDQSLQFVETNKYFLLQNSIAKSKSKASLGIPDSVYQKERKLLQKINSLKQEINNTTFNNDVEEYDTRLSLLNTTIEWENTRKIWNATDSLNFTLSDLSTSISIDNIKDHILDEHDLLLEYFQTADTLYTIAINKAQEKIIRLAKNPVLDTHLQNYIAHLFYKDSFTSKTDYIKFVAAAQYLYRNLVRPATSVMGMDETDENSRLIIVPDTQFSNVPFEAFICEPADTTYINYYGLHYLCKDFTIDYAYAINLLDNNLSVENNHGNEGILALSYSSTHEKSSLASRNDKYGELPFSAVELRNIRKWISNGKFFDGEQATESIFKSNASNYDIIHLALHGIGDTLDMLNSHLIFKAPGNKIEDGLLYAHELYGMDLNGTELAVLSACETGIGKIMQGEGVYSLARGFAYAGCPSIIMSLWKVDDASTSELMNYFYKNLSRGMPKDEALKKAKLSFLNNTNDLGAHPANWAAFIALGNNEPIELPGATFKWYYWFILIVIIGASIMVYRNIPSGKIDSI